MKNLEVFDRSDYSRATTKVVEAVGEIACKIRSKMVELDLDELWIKESDISIRQCCVKSNSGYSYRFLGIEDGRSIQSLEDNGSYYYMNDFSCWIQRASNQNFIKFANSVIQILQLLNEIETDQAEKAKCSEFFDFYEGWKSYEETIRQAKDFESKTETI